MNDPYKTLERQLSAAVEQRARNQNAPDASRRSRRWGWRWPRGIVPVLVGVALIGGGAATAAIVLGPNDHPANQIKQALYAGVQAGQAAPACRHVPARKPRLIDDPAPAWLTARLGLLRRAATRADHAALTDLGFGGREVLRRSVRVARASDGWRFRFWLSRGGPSSFPAIADPVGCQQVIHDASLAAASGFGEAVRAAVTRTADADVSRVRDMAAGRTLTFTLMTLRPNGRPAGGGGGPLMTGHVPATGSIGPYRRGNHRYVALSGLVPDGVTTVRITDDSGTRREPPVTVKTNDNVFHVLLPRRMGPHLTVEWRTAAGAVTRRTHPHY